MAKWSSTGHEGNQYW